MKSTLAILLSIFTLSSEAAFARYMECSATTGTRQVPEFSIKIPDGNMYLVEYEEHHFNFAILYDFHGTVPHLTVGVSGPRQNFTVFGEISVSLSLNSPKLVINCQLIENL